MIFKKIKKYKKLSILFFSILILINIITYVFQINSVKKIYNPKGFSIRLKKLTGKKQNPFPWLKITK